MRTARFASKLVNNLEENYSTYESIEALLSSTNIKQISNHVKEGTGVYIDTFLDDMAFVRTKVSMVPDGDGRPFYNMDVVVAKFDGYDKELILNLLKEAYLDKIAFTQNNGEALCNPLPEVEI